MLTMKRALGLWLPVAACMVLLLMVSGSASLGQATLGWDKLDHVAAYLVLGLLCLRAAHGGFRPLEPRSTLFALLLALGHGVLVELYQANIPERHGSVLDGVADLVGVCAAVIVLALWVGRRTGARPNWKET